MIGNFDWDEIKEKLSKSIKLDKKEEELSIIIQILEENIEENQMVSNMLKGEEEMKRELGKLLGSGPLDCEIDLNEEEKRITMRFKDEGEWKKVHELLHEMFFGDFFKKMMEAMMGAFGGMFGADDV